MLSRQRLVQIASVFSRGLLAFGYYQKHIRYAAISNLDIAIKLNPYNAEYFGLLAFVLIEEKEFKED